MIEKFCTDTIPSNERAEYWTDAIRRSFARLEVRPYGGAVRGSLQRASLGDIQVGHIQASPQRMTRTRGIIANDHGSAIILSLQETGSSVVVQDGHETLLTAGEMALLDTRRPYIRDFPSDLCQSVAAIPRGMLDVTDSYLARATGRTYPATHHVGGILAEQVSRITAAVKRNSCPSGPKRYLERGMVDVLTALVVYEARAYDDATPTAEETVVLHVREYIRSHLEQPELSPATIAAAHHISVRYLHQLFQGADLSVGRWIQHLRLEACREDLSRPDLAGLTVAAIAQRWGFASPAHFSRIFRAAYGAPPALWRRRFGDLNLPGPSCDR
ncbi:helix-turn-helix domain-containing protein [Streptomyces sp. NPDC127159]|uniref:helix-turn-helix domain-containing protein n=1 Tax=unclassified Streptomyces TaxID=2593676 RepID=UPI003631B812